MEDSWLDTKLTLSDEFFFPEESRQPEMAVNDDPVFQIPLSLFNSVEATTSPAGPTATPTRYRMRGYFVAGSTYEFWVTTSPSSPNPSGNPLVSVTVDSILSQ